MRKSVLVVSCAVVLASQGCTLTIPAGLLAAGGLITVTRAGTPPSTGEPVTETSPTVPGPEPLRASPVGFKPILPMPAFSPRPIPSSGPFDPGCPALAMKTLQHYDLDQDGSWSLAEFTPWYNAVADLQACVRTTPEPPPVMEELITNGDQEIRSSVPQGQGGPLAGANGGKLIAHNGGNLITNGGSGGGIIGHFSNAECFPDIKTAFNRADANHDGRISIEELCRNPFFPPVIPPERTAPTPPPGNDCKSTFAAVDANGNGTIEFDEFLRSRLPNMLVPNSANANINFAGLAAQTPAGAAPNINFFLTVSLRSEYTRMDTNQDGAIDAGEWCSQNDLATPVPTPIEASAFPVPLPSDLTVPTPTPGLPVTDGPCLLKFDLVDANHDGFVQFDEYADAKFAAMGQMKTPTALDELAIKVRFREEARRFDLNADGKLSLGEFFNACPGPFTNQLPREPLPPIFRTPPTPQPFALQTR